MSKGKKKGRRDAAKRLEAQIVTKSTVIADLESELAEAKKDMEDLVAQWREVNDEAIGL